MKTIKTLLSNTLTLVLLLTIVAGTLWFFSRPMPDSQPVAQETDGTPTVEATVLPATTHTPTGPPPDELPDPTDTPAPTRIIEVTPVIITVPPSPTPAPSPTPTPTFEPLSDKPIGGYVFSPPELILARNRIKLMDWKPGSSEELIVTNFEDDQFLIEFLNVKSGQRERVGIAPNSVVGKPVWLPESRQMSYIAYEGGETHLFFTTPGGQSVKVPRANGASPPVVPALDRRSPLVFDKQMRQLERIDPSNGRSQVQVTLPDLPIVEGGAFSRYQAAWSDKTDWVAYHNPKKFMLLNINTNEIRDIDLDAKIDGSGRFWVLYSTWSPDGQKMAMAVTSDPPGQTLAFSQLAIFVPQTGEVQLIEDTFTYVTNVAWAPDNTHILISAVIGQRDGYNVDALFLANSETEQIEPVPIMPDGALGFSFFSSLAWSPDGEHIIVGYAEQPGKSAWYHVSIQAQEKGN